MKVENMPTEKFLALACGAEGLLDVVAQIVDNDGMPRLQVLREKVEGEPSRWSLKITGGDSPVVLSLDSSNIEAMSVAVPIYLVQMIRELHDENAHLVAAGLRIGLQSMLPFIRGGAERKN